jgi:hypothetical protein
MRLVEFTSAFVEPHWCQKAHLGLVLEGELEIDFNGHTHMRRILFALLLLISPLFCHAQAPAVLGKCIVENVSGKERKDLARWVFLAMAAHPETKQFSSAPPAASEDAARAIGILFTRLLTEVCVKEAQEAAQGGGPPVVPSTIQFLAQIGVQELMTDKATLATLSTFSQFADRERIDRAILPR